MSRLVDWELYANHAFGRLQTLQHAAHARKNLNRLNGGEASLLTVLYCLRPNHALNRTRRVRSFFVRTSVAAGRLA
jgi:hypothetical protein